MLKLFIIPVVIMIFCVAIIAIFLITTLRQTDGIVVDGRIHSSFRVFYHENDIFPPNPIPNTLHFLQSFTDFIEMDSSLIAQFGNEPVRIYYEYTAIERLVIRYAATGDINMNPIVHEETRTISETYGFTDTHMLIFMPQNNDTPGGVYQIRPWEHLQRYLDFVDSHSQQMGDGHVAPNVRGFSAELFVDFTYVIQIPSLNFNHTLTQGYRLPISSEVFNITPSGIGWNNFTDRISTTSQFIPTRIIIPVSILLVLSMALSLFFIIRNLKSLNIDDNKYRQEALEMIEKYGNEIIVSQSTVNSLGYNNMLHVNNVNELVKLAVNLNKHIICYHNDELAQFLVVVDDCAYFYQIDYNQAQLS